VNKKKSRRSSKISLPNVTLITVTGVNYLEAQYALGRSMRSIEFARVILVGHKQPKKLLRGVEFQLAQGSMLDSIDEYSKYCIYNLWRHVDTEYVLVIQADGYVINPRSWKSEFLNYDYIGAPWKISPNSYIDPFDNHIRVGNGGFSLRSSKLLRVPLNVDIPWEINNSSFYKHMNYNLYSEDGNICVHNRHLYENAGCVFAPLDVALNFSIEQKVPEFSNGKPFGFHKRLPSLRNKIFEKLIWYAFKVRHSV